MEAVGLENMRTKAASAGPLVSALRRIEDGCTEGGCCTDSPPAIAARAEPAELGAGWDLVPDRPAGVVARA